MGHAAAGIAAAREGMAIGAEVDNPWGVANCTYTLARGLLDTGEWGEALEIARAGVATARAAGHPPTLVFNLLALGAVYRAHGALGEARALHHEARAIGEAMRHPLLREWSAIELCTDAAQAGEWEEAAGFARQALALRRADRVYVGLSRWLETEALVRVGDAAAAAADLEQAGMAVHIGPRVQLQVLRVQAVYAALTGDNPAAAAHLEQARALAASCGLLYDGWQIERALAETYTALGSPHAATSRTRAAELADAFAARVTDAALRETFRAAK
jgi:hypothetical protein